MATKQICDKCGKEEVMVQDNSSRKLPERWAKAQMSFDGFGQISSVTLALCPACAEPIREKHDAMEKPKYENDLANIMYDIACDALADNAGN